MDLSRSIEVFNPEVLNDEVHIIGVGATGSFVLQTLIRFGVKKINIWDFDKYEAHNINNQAITQSCCEKQKVAAQIELCKEINPEAEIIAHDQLVTPEDIEKMSGYVFLLVDSMKCRKELFEAIKKNEKIKWYWESRLGSDQGRVYCLPISKDFDYSKYETMHFYSDEDAEVSACGTSITIVSIVLAVTSLMVNQFIKIVMNNLDKEPYLNNFTLFDNMLGVYTENFEQNVVETVKEVTDEIIF